MPVRVYYEDTDAAGIVYYASYLRFFERARTEWVRDLGVNQGQYMAETGLAFAVRKLEVDYHKPARLDDLLTVTLSVAHIGRAQLVFEQSVLRGDTLLVAATVSAACVDTQRMRAVGIPESIRASMLAKMERT